IALEWALLQASAGQLQEGEQFLQTAAEKDPAIAPLAWHALAEGYTRVYRVADALDCLNPWLEVEPDNLQALTLRAAGFQQTRASTKAIQDSRRGVEKAPRRSKVRWRLILCLFDAGVYDEALNELEQVEKERPGDPEVRVRMARCLGLLGRSQKARQL